MPRNRIIPASGKHFAFTLLEVLVSSAILVVVLLLLITVADRTTHLWHHGEQRRDSSREARAGLEILTEDLHSAVLTTNPASFRIIDMKANGSGLFFLVSHPEEKRAVFGSGDLCAVGYFVAEDASAKGVLNLYRFHVSGETVASALEQDKLGKLYASASPTNTSSTELLARRLSRLDTRIARDSPSTGTLLSVSLSTQGGGNSRYSTIVRLPPQRDSQATNGF